MPQVASVQVRSLQTESLSADADRLINDILLEEGVVDVAGDSFEVTEDTGSNLRVLVGSGSAGDKAVVKRDGRVYIGEHTNASQGFDLAAADADDDRIDLVIFRIYDDEADSSGDTYGDIEVIEGTPAGSPSAPAVPAGAIALAEVLVAEDATSVQNADITDRRERATLNDSLRHVSARVDFRSTGQAITSGSNVVIQFNGILFDSDSELVRSAGVYTVGKAGRWRITAQLSFESNSNGNRITRIRKDSTVIASSRVNSVDGGSTTLQATKVEEADAGDTFDVQAFQNSGGDLDVEAGSGASWVSFEWLGP